MLGKIELGRIHILKKQAALTDDKYRSLLFGAAGVDSAAKIETPDQYYKVISCLEKYLLSVGILPSRPVGSFLDAVQKRAARILGTEYRKRLSGYLRKMGKTKLEDCNDRDLRRLMGFLSSIEKTGRK